MRVLYLTMNPNRASTTVPTEGWFRFLRPLGLEPVLVSDRAGEFDAWAREQGVPTYQVLLPFPDRWRPWPSARTLLTLRGIIKRHRIELVHCNEHDVYPIGQYAARLARLPRLVSVHFTMDRGYCEWAFSGRRAPDRMLFVSGGNLEACRPGLTGLVDERRWQVLYNGLDLEHFAPDAGLRAATRSAHALDGCLVLGVACALRPRKQLEHLFRAAARLPTPNLAVLVAGGPVAGDEAYAENLLAEGRAQLGDRLRLLGHCSELRGFYNALDLFVNTSQEEACSISVIEALACGCPVVGYPSKSVDEQILPGGGEIVEQDRDDLLSDVLQRWLADAHGLARARQAARRRAEQTFDIRKLARDLWTSYQQIVDGARS